jgi:hypothetical protein
MDLLMVKEEVGCMEIEETKEVVEKRGKISLIAGKTKEELAVQLKCGHRVSKDSLIEFALKAFLKEKSYSYSCLCSSCKGMRDLESVRLDCGCVMSSFGKKVDYVCTELEVDCGRCTKGNPLTPIDLGLINDYDSFELTSLILFDYSKRKLNGELIDEYKRLFEKQKAESIIATLRQNNVTKNLYLRGDLLTFDRILKIFDKLKSNSTVDSLDLQNINMEDKQVMKIGEMLEVNRTLSKLYLSGSMIKNPDIKAICEALKIIRH